MSGARFPLWIYVAVAAALAGSAYGAGSVEPRLGMIVAAGASLIWVAYNVRRFGKVKTHG